MRMEATAEVPLSRARSACCRFATSAGTGGRGAAQGKGKSGKGSTGAGAGGKGSPRKRMSAKQEAAAELLRWRVLERPT